MFELIQFLFLSTLRSNNKNKGRKKEWIEHLNKLICAHAGKYYHRDNTDTINWKMRLNE